MERAPSRIDPLMQLAPAAAPGGWPVWNVSPGSMHRRAMNQSGTFDCRSVARPDGSASGAFSYLCAT